VFWLPLSRAIGLSAPKACPDMSLMQELFTTTCDWKVASMGWMYTLFFVLLGIAAAVWGGWLERVGPRKAGFVSALCWCGGLFLGAIGVYTHQLWLLWLGSGVIGGIGLGLGYISPVSTLVKWFPDRRGMATGMAIMGFGGGALIASPLSRQLMDLYDPAYDGTAGTVPSGSAVALLFLTLGLVYLVFMLFGAFIVRVPADDWRPVGFDPSKAKQKALVTRDNVSAGNAIKTRQFWLLWIVLFCNVTAGIGILEQAAPMIQDFFRNGTTSAVAATAAAGFVGLLSLFNMGGRFVWSTTSDYIGRKPIYMVYLGVGLVLYVLLATIGSSATWIFVILAAIIISFYGGGFATIPAYLRDLFGTYQVGAIHGRLLTAWSAAGVAGPLIVNTVLDTRGTPGELVAGDYRPALFIMVGLLAVGFVANLLVKPVAEKWHEPKAAPSAPTQEASTVR
jgi:MFS family permease